MAEHPATVAEHPAAAVLSVDEKIQGLIFDCDGTLVDTLPLHYAAWQETFGELGLSCPLDFLVLHNGKPTDVIVELYNAKFGCSLDIEQFTADKERRTYALLERAKPLEPVAGLARRYYSRLPMAVVSGSNRPNVERALQAAGLKDLFAVVLTADDGFPHKPDPGLFLEAARRLGVSASLCQVFEDADSGLEAARRAGMLATDIRPFGGGYL